MIKNGRDIEWKRQGLSNYAMSAFGLLKPIIGDDGVLDQATAQERYGVSTSHKQMHILGALLPTSISQVAAIMRIANNIEIPIYPISTGKNWGYGTALPSVDGSLILDLSRMDRIIEMDAETGVVTVEPGVTQQMLFDFLEENHLDFMVPITGAGPDCSLIGNALERGFGMVPEMDHFAAVMNVEAVLPTGEIYRSGLHEMGGERVNKLHKWGLGPYIDGLFAQSNLGVVTQMSIALRKKPDQITGFSCSFPLAQDLEIATTIIRELNHKLGGIVGGIQLMDANRLIASSHIGERAQDHRRGTPAWLMMGAFYGDKALVAAAKKVATRVFKEFGVRPRYFTRKSVSFWLTWLELIPALKPYIFFRKLLIIKRTLDMMHGVPSFMGLNIVYNDNSAMSDKRRPNPARDGIGLIWYSPLVPMNASLVQEFETMVTNTLRKHGFRKMITLSAFSSRSFDATIPLFFDPNEPDARQRARRCYEDLVEQGITSGFVPYRLGIDGMNLMVNSGKPFWKLAGKLKAALDPKDILAPGRYAPRLHP